MHATCIASDHETTEATMATIRSIWFITATITALGSAAIAANAPAPDKQAPDKQAAAKEIEPNKIDPQAMDALDRMGNFLREQQSFTVHEKTETDYVLDSGQKVRLDAQAELRVRRPDHLRADVTSPRKERQYFYDGKTFTMTSPKMGYYAQVPAPPKIIDLADELEQKYAIQLPLVDLFRWGTDRSARDQIKAAMYIGKAKIDGVECDQYAFRQPGLDWQVWIESGDKPVPRKILLTTTDDPARPEFAVNLSWDLGTKLEDSEFAFSPPKEFHRIQIAEVGKPALEARSARQRDRDRDADSDNDSDSERK